MFRQLKQFKEEDFYVLGGPLKSGRQSPDSLAGNLLISIFLIVVFAVIANFFVFIEWPDSSHDIVLMGIIIYDILVVVTIILAIVYSLKDVYRNRQASQYLVTVWVSQFIFGQSIFLISMFMLFDADRFHHSVNVNGAKIGTFMIACYVIGLLIYIISFQRMVYKMKHGDYQKGTYLADSRQEREAMTDSEEMRDYAIRIVLAFVAAVAGLIGWLGIDDVEMLTYAVVGVTLFFIMIFILPEQMIIWYCIRRFESFQFDVDAEPDESDETYHDDF